MKIVHIKIGEFIYFSDRRIQKDAYRILLLDRYLEKQKLDIGLFDCRRDPNPTMKICGFQIGERKPLFLNQVTLTALKAFDGGINFSVSAPSRYGIESDIQRRKP